MNVSDIHNNQLMRILEQQGQWTYKDECQALARAELSRRAAKVEYWCHGDQYVKTANRVIVENSNGRDIGENIISDCWTPITQQAYEASKVEKVEQLAPVIESDDHIARTCRNCGKPAGECPTVCGAWRPEAAKPNPASVVSAMDSATATEEYLNDDGGAKPKPASVVEKRCENCKFDMIDDFNCTANAPCVRHSLWEPKPTPICKEACMGCAPKCEEAKPRTQYWRHGSDGLDGFMTIDGKIVSVMKNRNVREAIPTKGEKLTCEECLKNEITADEWVEIQRVVDKPETRSCGTCGHMDEAKGLSGYHNCKRRRMVVKEVDAVCEHYYEYSKPKLQTAGEGTPVLRNWMCPVCCHCMTEEESKGYTGCPTGIHAAKHVNLSERHKPAAGEGAIAIEPKLALESDLNAMVSLHLSLNNKVNHLEEHQQELSRLIRELENRMREGK